LSTRVWNVRAVQQAGYPFPECVAGNSDCRIIPFRYSINNVLA
jgi:hypothetical protein